MDKLDRRFPRFDNKLDPKAEREITLAIQRIYDTLDQENKLLKEEIEKLLAIQGQKIQETSELVNGLGTRLTGLVQAEVNPIEVIGSGTVSSVGLNGIASFITVVGSPITGSGSFSLSLNNQTANKIFAGPTTGAAAIPTFRSLVAADLPSSIATKNILTYIAL